MLISYFFIRGNFLENVKYFPGVPGFRRCQAICLHFRSKNKGKNLSDISTPCSNQSSELVVTVRWLSWIHCVVVIVCWHVYPHNEER